MLKQGQKAPTFTLLDQEGKTHTLADYAGQWVLLYFYPKDDTPGCTKEACTIRDAWPKFKKLGIKVFGVSTDSTKSHAKFVDKYDLPFTLLSDEEKKVVEKYGVTSRVSFLIDPKGTIAKIYPNVKPEEHAVEVLQDLKARMV